MMGRIRTLAFPSSTVRNTPSESCDAYAINARVIKRAEKDLASLPKADAQRIADALFLLKEGLTGDIKTLASTLPEYRLRIGGWRVLFEIVECKIIIYRTIHRKEAYR